MALLVALLHSLASLGIATQQSIAFSRANLHPKRIEITQFLMFGRKSDNESELTLDESKAWQLTAWQLPVMLLGNSIVFILVAIAIVIYHEVTIADGWGSSGVIALCFTISLVFILGCYLLSWYCIERRLQEALGIVNGSVV